jgi:hypothetical protein
VSKPSLRISERVVIVANAKMKLPYWLCPSQQDLEAEGQ